jgi:DNA-binding CsgD family transcriptional regulator
MNTQELSPTDRAGASEVVSSLLRIPETVQELWSALADDPLTGVQVLSASGRVLFANEAAAKTMMGPLATVEQFLASQPSDWGSHEYLAERLRLVQDVLRDGRIRVFRSICSGRQILATLRRIPMQLEAGGEAVGGGGGGSGTAAFIVTRYVGGDVQDRARSQPNIEYREAASIDLGPLGVLSRRELQVLALIGQGKSMPDAALVLELSVHTVQDHRKAIGKKLGVDDRVRLAEIAHAAGLRQDDATRIRFERLQPKRPKQTADDLPSFQ